MQMDSIFTPAFFSRPAHMISRAARLMAKLGDKRLRALGFSVGQLPILGMLEKGEPLSQKALALTAQIEQPSMAQILARMERDGLIHRAPDPRDKRASLITLTDAAQARLPQLYETLQRGQDELLAGLSGNEIATLVRLLQIVLTNLEALDRE